MERIDIKQFDLENEKVTEAIQLSIELHDRFLIYEAEYYSEVPVSDDDHSMGWKNVYNKFRIKIKRPLFISVEFHWLDLRELYKVEIEARGYSNTLKFYFKTEKEAENVYQKLDNYIFS